MDWLHLTSLSNKIQSQLKPLDVIASSGLYSLSNKLHLEILNKYSQPGYMDAAAFTNVSKLLGLSSYNKLNKLHQDMIPISYSTNIFSKLTNDLSRVNKQQQAMSVVLNGVSNIINSNLSAYNQHLSITEQLSRSFVTTFKLQDTFSKFFTADNYANVASLNAFDKLWGINFASQYLKTEDLEMDLKEAYDEIEELLNENDDLKDKVIGLQAAIISIHQAPKNQRATNLYKIPSIANLLEWFSNKELIQKRKLNPILVMLLMGLIYLSIGTIRDLAIEAYGDEIVKHILNRDTEPNEINQEAASFIHAAQKQIAMTDFVIHKTSVYMCNSTKTKKLGTIPSYHQVQIIKIIHGWCLVEATIDTIKPNTRKNRKKYGSQAPVIIISRTVTGWVQKEHLDMFQ